MSESPRFSKTPVSPPQPSWGKRLAGAAVLAGALGGAYDHYSDDQHQDRLNASVPDRAALTQRDEAIARARSRSAAEQRAPIGSQQIWERLQQAWREAPEEDEAPSQETEAAPAHELSEIEMAIETGRDIIFEMMRSGEYLEYLGHAREFDAAVMRRIAEAYGIPYDLNNLSRQPFTATRNEIRVELENQSSLLMARARDLQAHGRSADGDITNAIRIRTLGSVRDGVDLAIREGRGDLAMESMRQYGEDIHDPDNGYVWERIVSSTPEATQDALNQVWRYLDADDRASVQRRIEEVIRSLEGGMRFSTQPMRNDPGLRAYALERAAREQQMIEDFQRILHRWF